MERPQAGGRIFSIEASQIIGIQLSDWNRQARGEHAQIVSLDTGSCIWQGPQSAARIERRTAVIMRASEPKGADPGLAVHITQHWDTHKGDLLDREIS